MSVFENKLRQFKSDAPARWIYVPYDQLNAKIGPLSKSKPNELGIVMIESTRKARRRPYHKQKLAFVLANMRHFALEQAQRGVSIRYEMSTKSYEDVLGKLSAELGPILCMEPAERELRLGLSKLIEKNKIELRPHEGWLSKEDDFNFAKNAKEQVRMDKFYRHLRRTTGILMENGKPVGGKYSFDTANRKAWKGEPPAPEPLNFKPCLLYTSPSPRDQRGSRMPSSA